MNLSYACTTVRISIAFPGSVEDLETRYEVEVEVESADANRHGSPDDCTCIHLKLHGEKGEVEACVKYALEKVVDGERPFSSVCPKTKHTEPNSELTVELNKMISEARD